MKDQPPKNQELKEQEENIKKAWRLIPFWFLFPIIGGAIIIAFGGNLNTQFIVGTILLFAGGVLAIWIIYKVKRQISSKENPKP